MKLASRGRPRQQQNRESHLYGDEPSAHSLLAALHRWSGRHPLIRSPNPAANFARRVQTHGQTGEQRKADSEAKTGQCKAMAGSIGTLCARHFGAHRSNHGREKHASS